MGSNGLCGIEEDRLPFLLRPFGLYIFLLFPTMLYIWVFAKRNSAFIDDERVREKKERVTQSNGVLGCSYASCFNF